MAKPQQKKPLAIVGTLSDWPISKRLLELVPVHDGLTKVGCFMVAKKLDAKTKPVFAKKEVVPAGWRKDQDRMLGLVGTIAEAIEPRFRKELRTGSSGQVWYGFHNNLTSHEIAKLLEPHFAVRSVVDLVLAATKPALPAKTLQDIDVKLKKAPEPFAAARAQILDYVRGKGRVPRLEAQPHEWVTSKLLRAPIEHWNDVHDRLFEIWCATASPTDAVPIDDGDVVEPGIDRFERLHEKCAKHGIGWDNLVASALSLRWWPSTGYWVAAQLQQDGKGFVRKVLSSNVKSPANRLADLLLAVLCLPIDFVELGFKQRVLDLCRDPKLVPSQSLAEILYGVDEDHPEVRKLAEERVRKTPDPGGYLIAALSMS